jgi:hypothetical protein
MGRVANRKDAYGGESRIALSDAKDATHQHGSVTLRFLNALTHRSTQEYEHSRDWSSQT